MVHSSFKLSYLLVNLLLLITGFGVAYLGLDLLSNLLLGKMGLAWIPLVLFLFLMAMGAGISIFNMRYLKINTEKNRITGYSLLEPFGHKMNLAECIGYISINISTANGITEKLFLVDKKRKTGLAIDELAYDNFEQLKSALNLKEMKYTQGSLLNYIKLNFLNGIRVK
jgi:hypothetical protein